MSAQTIVTRYEDRTGTAHITQENAVAVLPDRRRIRLGYRVTGSYARPNDVHGAVIGWDAELITISWDSGSIELRPQDILTIEETR